MARLPTRAPRCSPTRSEPGSDAWLLEAVADNHRDWIGRWATAGGSSAVAVDAATLWPGDEGGMFPTVAPDPERLLRAICEHDCASVGYWSLQPDDRLGVRLVARGFRWGWRPHWMAIDLARFAVAPGRPFDVIKAMPPYARTLPYAPSGAPEPPGLQRLGVRLRDKLIGQVSVNPLGDVAGIYSMGVAPRVRGRGIGTALANAACRLAIEHGCDWAVLNATPDGERLYRRVGFRSLGFGQTWWYSRGPVPTARQTALTEAVGFGDLVALGRLAPTAAELDTALTPGGEAPLRVALITGRIDVARWLLRRRPSLIGHRYEPHGATLLHLAVQADAPEFVELALAHGVDADARDASFAATAAGWAEHLGRTALAARLSSADR